MENTLYYGDNLDILRKYIKDETIDLIYLDPPFNSQASYNILFKEEGGERSKSQIEAFTDFWTWDAETQKTFEYLTTNTRIPAKTTDLLLALERLLGKNPMSAYLVMMTIRLIEMKRVLKSTGTLYLHCDPTASHYLKIVLDAVFNPEQFVNEIIWQRTNAKGLAFTRFPTNHDTILRYSKSDKWTWNAQYTPHDPEYVEKFYTHVEPETGRRYSLDNLANPNKDRPNLTYEFLGITRVWRWTKDRMMEAYNKGLIIQSHSGAVPRLKRYLDEQEGTPIGDVWTDIRSIQSQGKEGLGFQTQKPVALLERIIATSSNPKDVILDPFCGCGTTIDAVEKLNLETKSNRTWIGIDITHLAINLIKRRLKDRYNIVPKVIGEPEDFEGAKLLAQTDRYQFEWWALSLIDARPINDKKKGSDRGIDGIIYISDPRDKSTKTVLVQVKSGHVNSSHIRDFKGTLERERAKFGIFITLEEPTKDMKEEALTYGFEKSPLGQEQIQKIQIMTVKELLNGIKPKVLFVNISYKKAENGKSKNKTKMKINKVKKYKRLNAE